MTPNTLAADIVGADLFTFPTEAVRKTTREMLELLLTRFSTYNPMAYNSEAINYTTAIAAGDRHAVVRLLCPLINGVRHVTFDVASVVAMIIRGETDYSNVLKELAIETIAKSSPINIRSQTPAFDLMYHALRTEIIFKPHDISVISKFLDAYLISNAKEIDPNTPYYDGSKLPTTDAVKLGHILDDLANIADQRRRDIKELQNHYDIIHDIKQVESAIVTLQRYLVDNPSEHVSADALGRLRCDLG